MTLINPWLADAILAYRKLFGDRQLRDIYEACGYANHISWKQHLELRAIKKALEKNPFLQTLRHQIELPLDIIEFLYWNNVDTIADLVQITEEELTSLAQGNKHYVPTIKQYLAENHLELYHCNKKTYKVRTMNLLPSIENPTWESWEIDSPGAQPKFSLSRPTIWPYWFDEYYKRYEFSYNELCLEHLQRRPLFNDSSTLNTFQVFFETAEELRESYTIFCTTHNIRQRFFLPVMPKSTEEIEQFIFENKLSALWKGIVKILIDVLERKPLFKGITVSDFLSASDEQKKDFAQNNSQDNALDLILLCYIFCRAYYQEMLDYLARE